MPLTEKGRKILGHMQAEYGNKEGKRVFYASANKGTITGVHPQDADDPNAVRLEGPFPHKAGASPIDPPKFQDNIVPGTGELAGEIIKTLPDNVSVASINEANKKFWNRTGSGGGAGGTA
jgi:hypothetical protein